jgi:two-component system, LytTR family, response regulator
VNTQETTLSAIIVDDEPIARRRIRALLSRDPQIRVVGECNSVASCEQLDPAMAPDLVFLDVQMPERDGFALLKSFRTRGIHPFVIFVTAYSTHAVDAYEAGAVDYLLKPFTDQRFAKALGRAKAALKGQGDLRDPVINGEASRTPRSGEDRLLITTDNRTILIPISDVELIQAADKHVKIFMRDCSYLTRASLRSIENRLDKPRFVRVHRSAIVNVERIVELRALLHGDYEVVLSRGTRVTVSRRFRRSLPTFS